MAKLIRLANGVNMPALGFGTWLADPGQISQTLQFALNIGYRHVDCASRYKNEIEIGHCLNEVFKRGEVKRSDVFLVGKAWPQDYTMIKEACEKSMKELQVDYLDQYLTHFPTEIHKDCETFFPENDKDLIGYDPDRFQEIWGELEKLYKAGMVRSIGACNFTKHKLSELLKRSPEVRPHTIQNEHHAHLPQWDLLDYCKKEGVSATAFASLGNNERPAMNVFDGDTIVLKEPVITNIAKKHQVSNAQVLLAWGMQRGMAVLTRSAHEHEIQDSYNSVNVTLDEQDMEDIKGIETRCRYLRAQWMCKDRSLDETWDGELLG